MPVAFEIIIISLLGLVLGSFATALVWRIPRNLSWKAVRSSCTACGHKLRVWELIPFFSWVCLRGRCGACGREISWRYPVIEIMVMAASLGLYAVWGFSVETGILMAALPFLVALLVIDIDRYILPDQLVFFSGALALIFVIYTGLPEGAEAIALKKLPAAIGAAALYAAVVAAAGFVIGKIKGRAAVGLGDVKFFAVVGLWLGIGSLPFYLIAAGITGLLWGLGWRFIKGTAVFPFGPALIIALYLFFLLKGMEIQGIIEFAYV